MTLHQFELFVSTAKWLNITKVSRELHISQPSLSQQLKRLQEECGITLFKRTSRSLELTAHGRKFLKDVEKVLAQVNGLKKKYPPAGGGFMIETDKLLAVAVRPLGLDKLQHRAARHRSSPGACPTSICRCSYIAPLPWYNYNPGTFCSRTAFVML